MVRALMQGGRAWGGHEPPLIRDDTIVIEFKRPGSEGEHYSVDIIELRDGRSRASARTRAGVRSRLRPARADADPCRTEGADSALRVPCTGYPWTTDRRRAGGPRAHGRSPTARAPASVGEAEAGAGAGRYSKRPPRTTEKMTGLPASPLRRRRTPRSRRASPSARGGLARRPRARRCPPASSRAPAAGRSRSRARTPASGGTPCLAVNAALKRTTSGRARRG